MRTLYMIILLIYRNNNRLSYEHPITIPVNIDECNINFLEHVEVLTNINYTRRGVLEVYLTSPSGKILNTI